MDCIIWCELDLANKTAFDLSEWIRLLYRLASIVISDICILECMQQSGYWFSLGNQKFHAAEQLLVMCRGELSAVIPQIMPKCLKRVEGVERS